MSLFERLRLIAYASAFVIAAFASASARASASAGGAQEVVFHASDRAKVYGWYAQTQPGAPIVVLFHQAYSSHHEYDQIVPRLNALGFATLAVDQRAGGPMFGPNLTGRAFHRNPPYLSALPDMRAALNWAAQRHPSRIIVWGSSYSAALVFVLAAQDARVKALIAFSPGEYFADKRLVHRASHKLRIPIFADSAASAEEIAQTRSIMDASPGRQKVQYVPHHGIHGSSTLLEDRDPAGARENNAAVLAFLRRLAHSS